MTEFYETTSYVAVADADRWFETTLDGVGWFAESPERRTAALIQATRDVDAEVFDGERTDADQEHAFPRDGDTEVPALVARATCEQALHLLTARDDPRREAMHMGVVAQSAGGVSESYAPGKPSRLGARAYETLRPLLLSTGRIS